MQQFLARVSPIPDSHDKMPISVVGTGELPQRHIEWIETFLEGLPAADEIFLFNKRPFKFQKMLAVRSETWAGKHLLEMELHTREFAHPYLVPFNSRLQRSFFAADPLAEILFQSEHYDFLSKRMRLGPSAYEISKAFLRMQLVESLVLLLSCRRHEDSNYLLDVLFGHVIALRLALERKILYTSFAALQNAYPLDLGTAFQSEVLAMYQEGDQRAIDSLLASEIWDGFKDLINLEMENSRRVVNSLKP